MTDYKQMYIHARGGGKSMEEDDYRWGGKTFMPSGTQTGRINTKKENSSNGPKGYKLPNAVLFSRLADDHKIEASERKTFLNALVTTLEHQGTRVTPNRSNRSELLGFVVSKGLGSTHSKNLFKVFRNAGGWILLGMNASNGYTGSPTTQAYLDRSFVGVRSLKDLVRAGQTTCADAKTRFMYYAACFLPEIYTKLVETEKEIARAEANGTVLSPTTQDLITDTNEREFFGLSTNKIPEEKTTMNRTINTVKNTNVGAAKIAAKITAGKALNVVANAKLVPFLPETVQAYANTPLGNLVVANIVAAGLQHFAGDNRRAADAGQAMITAAMVDFAGVVQIEKLVAEFLTADVMAVFAEPDVAAGDK